MQPLYNAGMTRFCFIRIVAAALILCAFCAPAMAWGPDGHKIVALIAMSRLTPAAQMDVTSLLGSSKDISNIANWADEIRRKREETGPWHYVDIPVQFATYDASRDGKNGNNVIDKLNEYAGILNDPSQSKDKREEALRFVVHFMGDLHQPMHCADRNDDKGGNFRLVWMPGEKKANNLHRIWDSSILDLSMGKEKPEDYAKKLEAQITSDNVKAWSSGTPTDWANESHRLAVTVCYNGIPADGDPPKITDAYIQASEKVIDVQLERGGVRLANLLNKVFK